MITSLILGVVSSTIAEIITWVNKKLSGTLLKGDGAFILAFGSAFIFSVVKEVMLPGFSLAGVFQNWHMLAATFGEVYAASQVYFYWILQKFSIQVTQATDTSQGVALK